MRTTLAVCSLLLAGCGTHSGSPVLDGGNADQQVSLDGAVGMACDDARPCPTGQRCHQSVCIPDNGTCSDDNQCQNDTYCDCTGGGGGDAGPCVGGVCVPYGDAPRGPYDPTCQAAGFPAVDFKAPTVKCHWTAPSGNSNVIMTPLVVDLDKDGKPEIVFVLNQSGQMVAIHGADCSPYWQTSARFGTYSQIAAADLDGDGLPEIVATDGTTVYVLDHSGKQLATAPVSGVTSDCSGIAIADVDNVAPPEILLYGTVFRYTKGSANLQVLFAKPVTAASWGNASLFADLDGDGKPEVVTGMQVFDGITGADKTPSALAALTGPAAYPAVADFNGDGKPDIVLVQSAKGQQQVSVFDYANNKVIFGPYKVAGGGWGGPPTVGDFDGDGVPDFGFASTDHYYVYAHEVRARRARRPTARGPTPGVLWEKPTHDNSSGGTASSTFDFNGDGIAEVVYRDECWLRVYNGPDGKAVFAQAITSGTGLEYPVIADVDNDGHADLVVPSDNVPEGLPNDPRGRHRDALDRLHLGHLRAPGSDEPLDAVAPAVELSTRYHITKINDDLSVPTKEPPNWTTYNNYRKNVQGMAGGGKPQADATGGFPTTIDNGGNDCTAVMRLHASICNRGSAAVGGGLPGTFYTADPQKGSAMAACTAATTMALKPGECEPVFCDWKNPPQKPVDFWFRVDDDGSRHPVLPECKNDNDILFLPGVTCGTIG